MKKVKAKRWWWLVKQADKTWEPLRMSWIKRKKIPDKNIFTMYYPTEQIALKVLEYKQSKGLLR